MVRRQIPKESSVSLDQVKVDITAAAIKPPCARWIQTTWQDLEQWPEITINGFKKAGILKPLKTLVVNYTHHVHMCSQSFMLFAIISFLLFSLLCTMCSHSVLCSCLTFLLHHVFYCVRVHVIVKVMKNLNNEEVQVYMRMYIKEKEVNRYFQNRLLNDFLVPL